MFCQNVVTKLSIVILAKVFWEYVEISNEKTYETELLSQWKYEWKFRQICLNPFTLYSILTYLYVSTEYSDNNDYIHPL